MSEPVLDEPDAIALPSERFWEELDTRMDERCPNARLPIEVRVCLEETLPELLGPGDRP